MFKKISFVAFSLVFALIVGFFVTDTSTIAATSVRSFNLLKSVSIHGLVSIPESGTYKMIVADLNGASSPHEVNLPTVDDNTGLIYVVKRTGGTNEYNLAVVPFGSETIEGNMDAWGMPNSSDYVVLAADDEANTWWVIGQGTTGN